LACAEGARLPREWALVVAFAGAAVEVLAGMGLADHAVGVTSGIVVVAAAGVTDFLNQLVGTAHEAALPEAFGRDEAGLIRFDGLDSSVRSVASVASPVVAGLIIFRAPGFEALLVVAALYGLGHALLAAFLLGKARRTAVSAQTTQGPFPDAGADQADDADQGVREPLAARSRGGFQGRWASSVRMTLARR
jgi:hypothetical protein